MSLDGREVPEGNHLIGGEEERRVVSPVTGVHLIPSMMLVVQVTRDIHEVSCYTQGKVETIIC